MKREDLHNWSKEQMKVSISWTIVLFGVLVIVISQGMKDPNRTDPLTWIVCGLALAVALGGLVQVIRSLRKIRRVRDENKDLLQ